MNQMAEIEQIRDYYRSVLPFYDAALEDRGDLPFWSAIACRWGSKSILELGCGTGRVTAVLAGQVRTTAADLLIEMLARAPQRAPAARFVVADLRTFAFASRFDLIVLADDPMAHLTSLDERMNVMQRIADHLTPDGRVVLEGLYRAPGSLLEVPRREIHAEGEKVFTVEEHWKAADDDGLWNASYRYGRESTIAEAASVVRSWTLEELNRLPETGLRVDELWGDFDERTFSLDAPRMLIVARRNGRPFGGSGRLSDPEPPGHNLENFDGNCATMR
jgi:SAM-dependent methyltransferase